MLKKNIDLPGQKNLLTNYFCFTATANQSTLISSSVNSMEHHTLEAAPSETMNSGAFLVESKNLGSCSSPDCYIENSFCSKTSDHIEPPYHESLWIPIGAEIDAVDIAKEHRF